MQFFTSRFLKWEALSVVLITIVFSSCNSCNSKVVEEDTIEAKAKLAVKQYPKFSKDSAFEFVKKQVDFGPRVPGTITHLSCSKWLHSKLKEYCDTTYSQESSAIAFDGNKLPIINLIGVINPSSKERILLCAHWDTRPFADEDPDKSKQDQPILGANDGGSGVAVLLEIARNLKKQKPNLGIDIIFFDTEDYGSSSAPNSFCLGSQFWAKKPHVPDYKAKYGILLDMVGGKGATFMWEGHSQMWAPGLLGHIWAMGQELGYDTYFRNVSTAPIIDDHKYVYEGTLIPMIDIIQYEDGKGFPSTWHTHADNLNQIDPQSLEAVGQTLLAVIFNQPQSIKN